MSHGRRVLVLPSRFPLWVAGFVARYGNGPLSTLRNSRDASGPALLFIQAEIGAVVRGVKAGEFDYPT